MEMVHEFNDWFNELKYIFFHEYKVSLNAKWDVKAVIKDYYDKSLTPRQASKKFFSEAKPTL